MRKLTKSKMKGGQNIYERNGYFFLDDVGPGFKLIKPMKNSDLISFIPDCDETDDKEKNCKVYVMQKWFVEDLKSGKEINKLIVAYLAKWDRAYAKFNHIVSIKDVYEDDEIV